MLKLSRKWRGMETALEANGQVEVGTPYLLPEATASFDLTEGPALRDISLISVYISLSFRVAAHLTLTFPDVPLNLGVFRNSPEPSLVDEMQIVGYACLCVRVHLC